MSSSRAADAALQIRGSIVALVTPMLPSGGVDFGALRSLVRWHAASGTAAIVAVGTTGESATLNVDEHCEVIATVINAAAGELAVIAGTGANSTSEAIELTEVAARIGADACLSVTPYYNKPTQNGLYLHHKTIAEAVDIPNILYNVPGRTAVDLQVETTVRLAQVDNIIGVKDATGSIERGVEIIRACPTDFAVYSGDDATAISLMLRGACGNISVTANVVPETIADLCRRALSAQQGGSVDRAALLKDDSDLAVLHDAMFVESNPIPVKWALSRMGKINEDIRLPLTVLDQKYWPLVEKALVQAGALVEETA
ncbi:MAG: 4-hydroxy-tetrahydrodipicolinate synthase [Gammaproteobacteria bacterium]|nr:4-hydroxy-tetrahydrodipicolinate synthase [Gammaproteobacteria bacterium]MBT8152277.1 4-hydroxy-tetrahydrodipicolinate synthase [Gammaproteobacteria bacterium]NND38608.1 4-hydroxy-tetrahydrodipicolinate synthase [Pseudomonadales bacterium]NNM11343.1 4-hydroxy-tetrahydrodipicolinate synthase [Pseudomonadales bacterium]RZV58169.1 MAG: 4-hydroxy-tetrahydrodipicolinate synthase [Pseudomonadales bacterium]